MQGISDEENIEKLCQLIWENKIPVEHNGILNREWEEFFDNRIKPTNSLLRIIHNQNSRGQTPCYLICRTANIETLKLIIKYIKLDQTLDTNTESTHLSNILHGLFWECDGKKKMIDIFIMFYFLLDIAGELTLKLLNQQDYKGEAPLLMLNELLLVLRFPGKQTTQDNLTVDLLKNICGNYFNVYNMLECYLPFNEVNYIHNMITKDYAYFVENLEYYFKEDTTSIQHIIEDFKEISGDDNNRQREFVYTTLIHSKKLLKIIETTSIYIFFNVLENDNNMIYPSSKYLEIRNYMEKNKEFYLKEGWEKIKRFNLMTI